jgi:hypothetical protein
MDTEGNNNLRDYRVVRSGIGGRGPIATRGRFLGNFFKILRLEDWHKLSWSISRCMHRF